MTYEFKLCNVNVDVDACVNDEEIYILDTIEANNTIEAFAMANEILKNINEKSQNEVKFKLSHIEAIS